jgi:hypothetical protein
MKITEIHRLYLEDIELIILRNYSIYEHTYLWIELYIK